MTDENLSIDTPEEFDLDQAVSEAYDKTTNPEPEVKAGPEDTESKDPEIKNTTDQGSEEKAKPANEQPLEPHSRWSAEDKEAFKTLPRAAQESWLRREGEIEKAFTQKTQEIAEQRKMYESLSSYRQSIELAERDPVNFVKQFIAQRNLDVATLFGQPAGENKTTDPVLLAQQQRIDAIERERNLEKQQIEQARIETVRKEVTDFENEKDEKGNLKYPHFKEVKTEMSALFKSNIVTNLKDAYERAIYSNPSVREKIFQEMKQAEEKKRIEDAKSAAAKAEKAVGVKVKTKTPAINNAKSANWEDDLENIVDQVMGA